MKQCNACGAQVADRETVCPQCGAPLPTSSSQPYAGEQKNKMVAALLALFLGGFGAHYFYLGKTTAGLICLVICCFTCGFGWVLPFISFIGLLVSDERHFEDEWLNPEKKFPIW